MQPNQPQGFYNPDQEQSAESQAVTQDTQPTTPQAQAVQTVGGSVDMPAAQTSPDTTADQSVQPAVVASDEGNTGITGDEMTYDGDFEEDGAVLDGPVSWTAHEYLHQEKGAVWFVVFSIVMAALIGLSIWMQAWSFTALIVVIAFIVIVYLRRPPRELSYTLNEEGLLIDNHLYKYENFKAFGVVQDGEEYSVMLIPTQRFQPSVTVYFPEEAGEDIVDVLGSRLPMKDLKLDAVDRLVRLLRL